MEKRMYMTGDTYFAAAREKTNWLNVGAFASFIGALMAALAAFTVAGPAAMTMAYGIMTVICAVVFEVFCHKAIVRECEATPVNK
jgi:hypothetical protein